MLSETEKKLAEEFGCEIVEPRESDGVWLRSKSDGRMRHIDQFFWAALVAERERAEKLEAAHAELHAYMKRIGDGDCELCEAIERVADSRQREGSQT